MPRVFHGRAAIPTGTDLTAAPAPSDPARDVAAYLATLGAKPDEDDAAPETPDMVAAGGRLFAALGCVGCHTLPDRDDWAADPARVPLRFVAAKWKPGALRAFLLRPDRHYAWIKMPNFHLSETEATRLAAYVASGPVKNLGANAPDGDPGRGLALFASSGCVHCHATRATPAGGVSAPALAAISAEGWARGCLDPASTPARKAPDFALGDGARRAIRAFATAEEGPGLIHPLRGPRVRRASDPGPSLRRLPQARTANEDRWTELQPEIAHLACRPQRGRRGNSTPRGIPTRRSRPGLR